jgi:uncharacterized membrane protein
MKKYFKLLWILFLFSLNGLSEVKVIESKDNKGKRIVLMENNYFKLQIDPLNGGRVSSFIWKETGKDWVLPGNAGFFMDHVWQQPWPGELLNHPYEVKIIETGPQRGTVEVSVTIIGEGDKSIQGVKLTRKMTIRDDSPRIDVIYRLDNPTDESKSPGLWIQNVINAGGSRDDVWTWRPTTRGIIKASFDFKNGKVLPEGENNDFVFDPVAGWSAETYPPTKEGIVFYMDYNYLRCLYNNRGSYSVEWWYEQVRLSPGKSFETKIVVWPIIGMEAVTHASDRFVGDLQMLVEGKNLILLNKLVAGPEPVEKPVNVKLQLIDYDTGKELYSKEFKDVSISKIPGQQKFEIISAPLQKNLLARATVTERDGRTEVYENYRAAPAVMGTEKKYQIKRPPRIRVIEKPSVITKTPHKRIKILHLRGLFQNYYRVEEVAKILNAELKHGSYGIFVYGPSISFFPSDYEELMNYDVIIINNVPVDAMDDEILEYIKDYVENGGVLFVIGGHWAFGGGNYQNSKLENLLPVRTIGPFDILPVKDGYLKKNGVEELPGKIGTLWIQNVNIKPDAKILYTAGDKPFWIEWNKGKGIVAVMTGVCYGERKKGMTLFWEWDDWPKWLGEELKRMIKETGGN